MVSLIKAAVRGRVATHGKPVTLWMPVMSVWVVLRHSSTMRRRGDA